MTLTIGSGNTLPVPGIFRGPCNIIGWLTPYMGTLLIDSPILWLLQLLWSTSKYSNRNTNTLGVGSTIAGVGAASVWFGGYFRGDSGVIILGFWRVGRGWMDPSLSLWIVIVASRSISTIRFSVLRRLRVLKVLWVIVVGWIGIPHKGPEVLSRTENISRTLGTLLWCHSLLLVSVREWEERERAMVP